MKKNKISCKWQIANSSKEAKVMLTIIPVSLQANRDDKLCNTFI